MSTLFGLRERAEAFASRVEDGDRVVRPVPGRADAELERLVGLVGSLRSVAQEPSQVALTSPREDFVTELRERLMSEADAVLTPQVAGLRLPTRKRGKRERRLVAVASAAVVLAGSAGVAAAAQSALPGQALYPLKRGIEQAQTSLTTSPTGKGHDLLAQADARLAEVQGLLAEHGSTGTAQVPLTLREFSTQARQGSDLLLSSYQSGGDGADVAAVRSFTNRGLAALQALAEDAPAQAHSELRDAALMLRSIDQRASQLCPTCSGLPPLRVPTMLLVSADAGRALRQADVLEARLDNSHPVVVPKAALRQVAQQQHASGSGSSGQGATGSTDPVTGPAPAGASQPEASAPPVPKVTADLGATSKDVLGKTSKDLGTTVGGLGDAAATLGDSVSTLLPDPTTGSLDPLP